MSEEYRNEMLPVLQRLNYANPGGNDKCINHQPELFVETYLHRFLADRILSGEYRLVLITGCSGDGKTEFIQWLESKRMGEEVSLREHPVGRYDWIEYGDKYFCTLYDAEMTNEEDEQGPDELLTDNLDDFEGEEWREPQCYRIFSINRDHLRSFLERNRETYPRLYRCVLPAIDDVNPDPNPALKEGILVVDLTFRSLVGDILREEEGLTDGCIFTKLVEKLCSPEYWAACEDCDAEGYCPIRANVKALDPTSGSPVAERLKTLLTAFHYRRIFHLTMRDAVSLLVHSFVTGLSCREVEAAGPDPEFIFRNLYFNRLFTLPGDFGSLLNEIDMAAVNAPHVDARLMCDDDLDDPSLASMVVRDLSASLDEMEDGEEVRKLREEIRRGRRRRLFFEDTFEGRGEWSELFPYRSFPLFDELAKKERPLDDDLTSTLLHCISLRDGAVPPSRDVFLFSLDNSRESLVTYYSAPCAAFELILPFPKAIEGHREYLPGYLLLRHRKNHNIALRINLDIFEYLLHGRFNLPEKPDYVPELMHRLRVFKEKLENELELREFIIQSEEGGKCLVERFGLAGGKVELLKGRE